jgi:hypothetical protein
MLFLSTYFSDILDLLRSSTTRKGEEEAAVVEDVEVNVEKEDSEDEVLVLEDTTGGQDSKSAEVIIYVSVERLNRVADPEPHNFDRWIRIHIRIKSWVRIRFKVKIQEL